MKTNVTKESADLAKKISSDFKLLWEQLGKPIEGSRYLNATFIEIIDDLDNLKTDLIAKTDGRPQALDLSEDRCGPTDSVEELKTWAECYDPGGSEKARVGGLQLETDELLKVRNWIDAVIKWHEQNPDEAK